MTSLLNQIAVDSGLPIWILLVALVWTVVWKACALWRSARKNHIVWFILFFVVHTFGILEILYIFLFSKISLDAKKKRRR